ncbi:hypothetical protein J5N97_015824 [Dioscorea zingiberensis]|uniref:C2H2-type domain-containing protein n=1 Tax=Dioscorea zingiberensis TaxID=325984 RepID=A0A9D5CJ45_9LILI|nr:hypothetical protein J5N97_015824 [Dioscorea zingiberensis]
MESSKNSHSIDRPTSHSDAEVKTAAFVLMSMSRGTTLNPETCTTEEYYETAVLLYEQGEVTSKKVMNNVQILDDQSKKHANPRKKNKNSSHSLRALASHHHQSKTKKVKEIKQYRCPKCDKEMKTKEKARKRCIQSCKQSAVCSLLDGDSWRSMVPRKKRSVKMPVIDIEEEEKKEKAALSLMALSKDTRPWGTADHCSNSQASDDDTDEYFNASVLLSEDEFKKPAWNVDHEFREKEWKKEVNDHGNAGLESGLKSVMKKMMIKRFECRICGKAFGSGQGLGCHKRAHKVS